MSDIDVVTGPAVPPAQPDPGPDKTAIIGALEAGETPPASAFEPPPAPPAPPVAPAPEPPAPAPADDDTSADTIRAHIDAAVTGWFQEYVHGSPVAQFTPAWNHMVEAVKALPEAIAGTVCGVLGIAK